MTIQRQYSLPNCTLLLEGLSDATTGNGQLDFRPVMTILVNAECRIGGSAIRLTGGREFFESLVTAVSNYAQEFLSDVRRGESEDGQLSLVQLQPINRNLHRLIVQRRDDTNLTTNGITAKPTSPTTPIEIDLNTVQLFDLAEAVDQFFADTQTLPSLSLKLTPLEKRYAKSDETVVKQAAPAALGLSSLAIAALALFFAPIPEVQKPREPQPQTNSGSVSPNQTVPGQTATIEPTPLPLPTASASPSTGGVLTPSPSPLGTETAPPSASPLSAQTPYPTTSNLGEQTPPPSLGTETASPSASPLSDQTPYPTTSNLGVQAPQASPSPLQTPSNIGSNSGVQTPQASPTPVETASPTPSTLAAQPSPSPSPTVSETPSAASTPSTTTGEIVDSSTLKALNQKVYEQIRQGKREGVKFPRQLVYRLTVRPDGTIVEYEPRNQPARDYVTETPFVNLKSSDTTTDEAATPNEESFAYFRVVITPKGVLQVSPWRGYR